MRFPRCGYVGQGGRDEHVADTRARHTRPRRRCGVRDAIRGGFRGVVDNETFQARGGDVVDHWIG
jgi:hypothetical protein